LKNLKKYPIGANMPKKIAPIIKGLVILPIRFPNWNHIVLNGLKIAGNVIDIKSKISPIHIKAKDFIVALLLKYK